MTETVKVRIGDELRRLLQRLSYRRGEPISEIIRAGVALLDKKEAA